MNSFPDEELLLESYHQYIIAKYKASDCSKIKPDLPSLSFYFESMKSAKFPFWLFLTKPESMACLYIKTE